MHESCACDVRKVLAGSPRFEILLTHLQRWVERTQEIQPSPASCDYSLNPSDARVSTGIIRCLQSKQPGICYPSWSISKLLHLAGWLCMSQLTQLPAFSMMLSKFSIQMQLVGLHPDEATEAIVDCALANRKPFAVVPCCVFPRCPPLPEFILGTPRLHLEQGSALALHDTGSAMRDRTAGRTLLEPHQM